MGDRRREHCRWETWEACSKVEGFDYASDLAAHIRENLDRSLDSNRPCTGSFEGRTNRNNIEAAVSLVVESLEGLHNDVGMESCDH